MESTDEDCGMHRIFVYGTLMSGLGNHGVLLNSADHVQSTFVGHAKTVKYFTMYSAGVPFVDPDLETSQIVGEVWDVSTPALARVDRLEGHPDWYFRLDIEVEILSSHEIVSASMYANRKFREFGLDAESKLIMSGDFKESLSCST
jgi:gamma-glutamylaminecyclotransferase